MRDFEVPAILTVLVALAGCANAPIPLRLSGDEAKAVTSVTASDLPPQVIEAALAAVPEMKVRAAQRKEREGRVYFDVEGVRADGAEVEVDVLLENGQYRVVEIQRDIAWSDVRGEVRAAAAASSKPFEPVRVIESRQADGTVIYELFAASAPEKPALEVRIANGKAEVLLEEWPH